MRRLIRGFTLIELMVGLAIVAILASLAGPSFIGAFERSRADSDIDELVKALNLARLEAINRGVNVSVSDTSSWTAGLSVELVGGATLRSIPAMAAGATLTEAASATSIEFNSFGGLASPSTAVQFTYTRGAVTRTVAVCLTGRIQTGASCS